MFRVHAWTARAVPALLLAALVTTVTSTAAEADPPANGPGSLLTEFASDGSWDGSFVVDEALDSAVVQADGKVVAGWFGASSGATIVRLLADGSAIDPAWNGGSAFVWAAANASGDTPHAAIAQDSAGRTYVTSAVAVPPPLGSEGFIQDVAVLRLTTGGTPDSTWGPGGVVTIGLGGNLNDHGTSLVFDAASNRMYVGAWQGPGGDTDFAVLALKVATGALDPTFSGDGVATTDFNGGNDTVRDIALAPGGDVVAVGYVGHGLGNDDVGVWRLNDDGTAASAFGGNGTGKAEYDLGNASNDGARSVAVDRQGAFYLGVRVEGLALPGGFRGGVLRLGTNGLPDTVFGRQSHAGNGLYLNDFGVAGDNAGITVDGAGRAVVVGTAGDATIARLTRDRYPSDTTFAGTGKETLGCGNGVDIGGAGAVTTAPNGDLVVVAACAPLEGPSAFPTVWKVDGSDQVTLLTPPVADPSGPNFANLNATGISVNSSGRTVTVAPGASLSLAFTYHFDSTVADDICTGDCITQVVAGFVNAGPDVCVEAGTGAEVHGGSAAVSGTFTAPSRPGRFYIAFGRVYENACTGGAGTWSGDGKFWSNNIEPTPESFLAEVNVVDGVDNLTVSPDRATVPFGQHVVPVRDISADELSGSLADLQASPLRVSPLRVSPLRVSPLRVSPLRVSPLRVSPLRVSPLRVSPLRVSPIPLSDVPLDPPTTWADVLVGTPFANQPLQNVTLQQVLDLDPAPAAVAGLSLADIDLSRTALRNVSLTAFLLGSTPASALGLQDVPIGADLSKSLLDLELTGVDMSPVYRHGIHVSGSTPFATDAPLPKLRLGDLVLSETPFGAVLKSAVPSSWYDVTGCTNGCATLSDVQANNEDTGLKDVATIGALLARLPSLSPAVGQILPGLVSRDQLGYELIDSDLLAAASKVPASGMTYTARFDTDCDLYSGTATIDFALPTGFRPIPNTAQVTVNESPVSVTTSTVAGAYRLTTGNITCGGAAEVVASVQAEPGLALGRTSDSVTASFGGVSRTASDDTPVTVVDSTGDTPVPSDPTKTTGTVFLGYISSSGNQDSYVLPNLPPGTELTVRLANVSAGHDDDLSVFGPGVPALHESVGSAPLRVSPLRVSPLRVSGVDDTTLDPSSDQGTAGTEPQPDVPVQPPPGSTVLGVSANRGDAGESLAYTVPDGASNGPTTIVVSGYNGSNDSSQPYSLLVSVDPPAAPLSCAAPSFPSQGQGTPGSALTSIPAGTETLILTDQKRLGDIYGATAATNVMTKLQTLAARSDVHGVVIPVEAGPNVQAAYNAWDASSCSPGKANEVVKAINGYLDTLRNGSTSLKYIVIAGGDQVVPMGRAIDRMDLENESSFAPEQVYSGQDNALSGSLRGGYLLSDDPYGDLNPVPWLDSALYVPDIALGRLVETPADITKAVDQFVASNGVRSPVAAYTAGYDFNSDGAQLVADRLARLVAANAAATNISGTWSKTDAISGMGAAAHGYVSVNAHYDAYRALPADEFSGGTQNQLLTPTDLPADLSGGVLFTIGCHTGLNVDDTFVATTSEAVRKADWAQGVASRGGVLAANTGFGYGDSAAIAYSERLMADFAANLDGRMTVGQALMFAKQSYVHLPLAVVDAKVMQEATFYGLPMYRLGATGTSAPAVLPTAPPTGGSVSEGSLQTASFVNKLVAQSGPRGTWYAVQDAPTSLVQSPLTIPGRPIQPETTTEFARLANGQVVHGLVIDGLTTRLTTSTASFNPVYSAAMPDSSTTSPEPQTKGSFFPATLGNVVERATPGGIKDVVVLHPGQFRSASPDSGLGFQQLADSMSYHLLYSDKADVVPPEIGTVDGTVSGGTVTFSVTSPSTDVTSVTVLYLARSSTTGQAWTKVPLSLVAGKWAGSHAVSTPTVEQYFVQVVDDANNVSVSSKKGQDFEAPAAPTSESAPTITVLGTPLNNEYVGPQTVAITGQGPLTYTVGSGAPTAYTGPIVVAGAGSHTITATSPGGTATLTFIIIGAPGPSVSISSPSAAASYVEGQDIPAVFSCDGYGTVTCNASPATPDNTLGTHVFTVNAVDGAGKTASASVTYVVRQSAFRGLLQPVDDGPGLTPSVFKKGSTVPLKFQVVGTNGVPITDAQAAAIVAGCGVTLAYGAAGSMSAPVDESVVTTTPDSGTCFKYDAATDQFIFNFGTKGLTSGQWYLLRIHFVTAGIPDHTVRVGIR
jgi:uncharacterized delta-60 repeat protein